MPDGAADAAAATPKRRPPPSSGLLRVSGHTVWRRLRFAYSLVGPFVAMGVISFGKDLYLLEFGASAEAMGAILLACSFVSPVMDSAVGNLQDRGIFFGRFFPSATWGRRAPWHLTHNSALAPLVLAFFLPPSYALEVLHTWFTILSLLVYWCVAASINAFEAARVEIYAFKEERVTLEQYCKFTVAAGGGIGSGAAFACLTLPTQPVLIAAGLASCLTVASGGVATEVLREARCRQHSQQQLQLQLQLKPQEAPDSLAKSLRSGLVLRMLAIRTLQGIYETLMPALQLYYYTFVFKMDKGTRFYWFGLGAFLMGVVELGLAPVWSQVFARSTELMLYIPLALRLADVVLAPIMLLAFRDVRLFVAYLCVWRICNSSFSYWRISACAWICDHEGGEREGLLLGLFSMVNNLGRAVTSALAVLGLGWAGLVTSNCLQTEGDAREACENEKIYSQPESLRTYLEVMIAVAAPLVELVICALTYEFPIRPGSQLLADLCQRQADAFAAKQGPSAPASPAAASAPSCSPSAPSRSASGRLAPSRSPSGPLAHSSSSSGPLAPSCSPSGPAVSPRPEPLLLGHAWACEGGDAVTAVALDCSKAATPSAVRLTDR